ncbi:MAG: UDP-N-acetylenolpyruvoylglucosamine reductase [Candidatus Yonathbacteria bacterium RIFCSPLOWO2_01_FULL_47_33b]|uniref:UDP-N-acetylenolpyruvoylglucosamine reductase n=1 Tax=Candidatus Yonathbacteria bacterium RIFCSPLOWO2_01_FULL_47_33b TaxID=1802727 RepID=A0A1G2SE23_9BACT|nr:MAG: UDP-N-acetylenolpyruvoylglucosamine reductase [Candidatus Yonathbacteria bacterium RIFCSPLOWO2_01_FULL_47_33b]
MTLRIKEHIPLAPMTTMRVGGSARFFARVKSLADLRSGVAFARSQNLPIFVLGGGSNILVPSKGFPGLVLKIECKGIFYEEEGSSSHVIAGAGEVWDEVVRDTVKRGLWGIENLSLIPGTIGGAVVQNLGAYGVEACDALAWVEAFDMQTMKIKKISRDECAFGYRESIFKKNSNLIVVRAAFSICHDGTPHIEYQDVKTFFAENKIEEPALVDIRKAIVAIRTAKMPSSRLGTAGSFFKNPVVSADEFARLERALPGIKAYKQEDNTVKLSAAWLLDKVGGFRGHRQGDAGVYEHQALILVNHGGATAENILSLAQEMKNIIKEKTNVTLEEEVVMMRV